jgi:hypothetical protein
VKHNMTQALSLNEDVRDLCEGHCDIPKN